MKPSARAAICVLAAPLVAASCAVGVQRQEFGEDFSDAGVRDAAEPSRDGSSLEASPRPAETGPGDATPVDGGGNDQVAPPADALPDTPGFDASPCAAETAVVAGDETSLKGAVYTGGAWTIQAIAGGTAASGPSIAALGAGFVAAFRASGDGLFTVTSTGAVWSAPGRVAAASARSTPSLATAGTTAHLVFQEPSYLYVYSPWNGAGWDAPTAIGAPQSFGFEAPSAAAVGATVVVGFGGDSEGALFTQERSGAAWAGATAVAGTAVCGTSGGGAVSRCGGAPGLLATGGATVDLLTVHIDKTTRLLTASTRDAASKVLTTHGAIAAGTTSDEEVFLAKAGASRAVLTFRGQNGKGYAALADLAASPPRWTAPVALSTAALLSVPRVAPGVCGDDAIVTFVVAGGAVKVMRLQGTTWGLEESVGTLAGAKFSAIATRP